MTDLTKGIIEIDGFEISKDTKPSEIKKLLNGRFDYHNVTPSGKSESFMFHNVCINNRLFSVNLYFYLGVLEDLRLNYMNEEGCSYERIFEQDCLWLKNNLGEPSKINEDGNSYYYNGLHIYSFIQRDLSRNPAEAYIVCKYSR